MFSLSRILPKYKSAAQWAKHGLVPPSDTKSFLAIKDQLQNLCSCIFNTGYLFHWKAKRPLLDADVHCTNDLVCEEAMWLLVDALNFIDQLEEVRDKGKGMKGTILQKLHATIEKINALPWPDRDENETTLLLNLNKDWSKISNGIKLPWLLLPSCNHSLRIWIHAELVNCQFMDQPLKTTAAFTTMAIQTANLVDRAADCATNCPADYKTVLAQELKRRQLTALYWLSDAEKFQNNYAERFRILKKANDFATDLEQVNGAIDPKLAARVKEKYAIEKNQFAFVTGCCDLNKDISDVVRTHITAGESIAPPTIESLMAHKFSL